MCTLRRWHCKHTSALTLRELMRPCDCLRPCVSTREPVRSCTPKPTDNAASALSAVCAVPSMPADTHPHHGDHDSGPVCPKLLLVVLQLASALLRRICMKGFTGLVHLPASAELRIAAWVRVDQQLPACCKTELKALNHTQTPESSCALC